MEGIVILGSLSSNRDPMRRVQVFETVPFAFTSLEEAVQAAKDHYWMNFSQGTVPQFRVYQTSDPDGTTYAFLEVSDGREDMSFVALYKIIAGKYRWAALPQSAVQVSGTQNPMLNPTDVPAPAGVPLQRDRFGF